MSSHRHILRINVSGLKFAICCCKLDQYPATLLGSPKRRAKYYDPVRREYFLDRHRPTAEAVFHFYHSSGTLQKPEEVPMDTFIEELKFYDLGKEVMEEYLRDQGYVSKKQHPLPPESQKLKRTIWLLFEHSNSSKAATFIAVVSITFILVSIIGLCLETLPVFHKKQHKKAEAAIGVRKNSTYPPHESWGRLEEELETGDPYKDDPFFLLETVCICWFTIELILRFYSCPNRRVFFKSLLNVVDLLSILPYYVTLVIAALAGHDQDIDLRFLFVLRVLRTFKLSRYNRGFKVLGKTLARSLSDIGMLMVFLSIVVVLFSSIMYFVESADPETKFQSIPDGFWWAIITIVTVGYGDMYPTTTIGKLIGALCVISGLLSIALPVPVIVSNFEMFYNQQVIEDDVEEEPKEKQEPEEITTLSDIHSLADRQSDVDSGLGRSPLHSIKSKLGGNKKDDLDQESMV